MSKTPEDNTPPQTPPRPQLRKASLKSPHVMNHLYYSNAGLSKKNTSDVEKKKENLLTSSFRKSLKILKCLISG